MIAHRFEPNTGDRFSNLLFGTKECNTAMMRAEAAVEQLLYSGNIYAVKLEVQAKHDLSSVTVLDRLGLGSLFGMKYERTVESTWDKMANSYPRWLALEVEYTIQYYYPSPNGQVVPSDPWTSRFHPFSSQCPLFFEYRLDRIILNEYLNRYKIPFDKDINKEFGDIYPGAATRHEPLRVNFDGMSRGRDETWCLNEEEFDAFDMGITELGIEEEFKEVSEDEEDDLFEELLELGKDFEDLKLGLFNDSDEEDCPLICAAFDEDSVKRKIQKTDKQSTVNRPKNKLQILKAKKAAIKRGDL
ncbi:hypothetical protein RSOLAG1IB_07064 [Rhizoctonia solani AG-1 IB]|uniref:Uncharacterized protein n=1 Tax=Thanatephorus cucumeris (strain AG1-IB / isolate 7/3/14) TaxID=1108050 RepID=A0A0B7F8Q6_THACB|nr:hypothetical protein RSOLAG1IB_07064 [Rhizoctonia solani AG-1 IB]